MTRPITACTAVLVCAAALLGGAAALGSDTCGPRGVTGKTRISEPYVTVFEHGNQVAPRGRLYVGEYPDYDSDLRAPSLRRNMMSSIKVPAGLKIESWHKPNFDGSKWTITGPFEGNLPGGNDDYDSSKVTVLPGYYVDTWRLATWSNELRFSDLYETCRNHPMWGGTAYGYEHSEFTGTRKTLGGAGTNIRDLGSMNNKITSLKLPYGLDMQGWSHPDYRERYAFFPGSQDTSRIEMLHDDLDSTKVFQAAWCTKRYNRDLCGVYSGGFLYQDGCSYKRCGDGSRQSGEQCDDGNCNDNDHCLSTCRNNVCGDGVHNQASGSSEECDNGGANSNSAACTSSCKLARCGDGFIHHGAEECDTSIAPCTDECMLSFDGTIQATDAQHDSIRFYWSEPASNIAHTPITGYEIDVRINEGAQLQGYPKQVVGNVREFRATGLTPNVLYAARVKALTAADEFGDETHNDKYSPYYSAEGVTRTTCGCSSDNPTGRPSELSVEQQVGGNLQFKWRDHSYCETQFSVQRDSDIVESFQVVAVDDCGEFFEPLRTVDISNPRLAPGVSYDFCLFAAGLEGYRSSLECEQIEIAFESTVRVSVSTEQNTPVPTTSVTLTLPGGTYSETKHTDQYGEVEFSVFARGYTSENLQASISVSKRTGDHVHEFSCGSGPCNGGDNTQLVEIEHLDFIGQAVAFIDTSAFKVSGMVVMDGTAQYTETERPCPVHGVEVCATSIAEGREILCVTTEVDGSYELAIANGLQISLSAELANHTLALPAMANSMVVTSPVDVDDIVDSTRTTMSLEVFGGECRRYIGRATVAFKGLDCTEFEREVTLSGRLDSIDIPSLAYDVVFRRIEDIEGANVNGISRPDVPVYLDAVGALTKRADARSEPNIAYNLEWMYRTPTVLSMTSTAPPNPCSETPFLMTQFAPYNVTVSALEMYGEVSCDQVSGDVRVYDRVSGDDKPCGVDNGGCLVPLEFDGRTSGIKFPVVPLYPKVFDALGAGEDATLDDYTYTISAEILQPARDPVIVDLPVLVTGHRPRGERYPMQLPDSLPWLILRDPPGDMSSAAFEREQTQSVSWTMSVASGSDVNVFSKISAGAEVEQDLCVGIGVESCQETMEVEVGFSTSSDLTVGDESERVDTATFEITTTESFATSENPGLTGEGADMFLLPALSVAYALTDEVRFNATTCRVDTDVFLQWEPLPPTANSISWQSAYDIENTVIPNLETVLANEEEEFRKLQLQEGIDGWENLLTLNRDLKSSALPLNGGVGGLVGNSSQTDEISRFSFSGGGSTYSYSTSTSASESREITFTSIIESSVALELSSSISVFSVSVGSETAFATTFKMSIGNTRSNEVTNTVSTSFTLGDSNLGDSFDVSLMVDPVFGTPVFETNAGQSMCPHEAGTVPREAFELTVDRSSIENIPPEGSGVFTLRVINRSPTLESASLMLAPVYNPGALNLKYAGAAWVNPIEFRDLELGTTEIIVEAFRGPLDYSYEVGFELYSGCEFDLAAGGGLSQDYLAETVSVFVDFLRPCSPVAWAGELAASGTWAVTLDQTREDQLYVVVRNPDYSIRPWAADSRLRSVMLQYREPGDAEWTTARNLNGELADLTALEDEFGFAEFFWFTATLPDGRYELRTRTSCEPTIAALAYLDTYETEHLVGSLDRAAPALFGAPEPADEVYWPGDEISFTFTEPLLCNLPHVFTLELKIKGTTTSVSHRVVCEGRQLLVGLGMGTALDDLIGETIEMSVTNVRDVFSNRASGRFSWEFGVPSGLKVNSVSADVRGITLDRPFIDTAGAFDSPERERFVALASQELAAAMDIHPGRITVDDVREGSVIVDITVAPPRDGVDDNDALSATRAVALFHERAVAGDDIVYGQELLQHLVYDEANPPVFRAYSDAKDPSTRKGGNGANDALYGAQELAVSTAGTAVACAAIGAVAFTIAKRRGYVTVHKRPSSSDDTGSIKSDVPLQELGA